MILAAVAIAKKIPRGFYAFGVLVILLCLLCWKCYHLGQDNIQVKWDASIARGRETVAELSKKQVVVTTKIETVTVEKLKVVHEKGKTIIKEIPVYIPVDSPDLPSGFRVLHDAAAANAIPSTSGSPDAQPVPVRTATETISSNYTTSHAAILELTQLREWVRRQREVYLAECKRLRQSCSTDN